MAVEVGARTPEQSRARYPDESGYVERDGVRLYWEVYGEGERTVLLMPTWSIIHSRHWKMQIPYLARHCRVVTFDGRGNGRSDRPSEADAYREEEFAADTVAVLDATGTERAVVVSLSRGAERSLLLAAGHPERVEKLVFIAPALPLPPVMPRHRAAHEFVEPRDEYVDWGKWNRNYWVENYEDFLEFFFSQCFTEPHSTKQREDAVGWGLDTDAETLVATQLAPRLQDEDGVRELLARIDCPVLVIHGTDDAVRPWKSGARLAELAGGELVLLEGSGHLPHARDPVKVNLLLRDFVAPPARPARWVRGKSRRKRALFISSPIGLGHAQRDAAIAAALRELHPDLEIDWLAQHPVTAVLEARGERIHPGSAHLANESQHIESESAEHDLHCFQAIRRMDEILLNNFMVFHDIVRDDQYDLWIGDEAWELDYYLHENPEEKRAAYVWLTDFVGWLPMPDGGEREAFVTSDYNAEMIEHIARYPRLRDRALFVGDLDDVVPDALRARPAADPRLDARPLRLPRLHHGLRPGRVRRPGGAPRRARLRAGRARVHRHRRRLGRRRAPAAARDRRVPGGGAARRRAADDRRRRPADRSGRACRRTRASRSAPYVHDLYRHLAACDLAVVQGGLTTSMELTANRRPFLYFPLRHHFEQNFHVRHRLGALRRRPLHGLRRRRAGGDRRGDRGGDRPRGRLPAGRPGGAARAAPRSPSCSEPSNRLLLGYVARPRHMRRPGTRREDREHPAEDPDVGREPEEEQHDRDGETTRTFARR